MKESREQRRKRILERAKEGLTEAYSSSDHSISQAINAYKEIEKMKGLVFERLEEWYSIYFPEIRIGSHEAYSRIIMSIGKRSDASEQLLTDLIGDKGKKVYEAMQSSYAKRDMEEKEYKAVKELAGMELQLDDIEAKLDSYLENEVKRTMPNIAYLIDYRIAAELLGKAGSLQRLATMPSGTVQLLGAEKALFKHIKFGSKPPKYGVLFKLSAVTNAARGKRGRIARAYATKICIAARADAFSKRFIADKLKEQLDKTVEAINKEKQ